MLIRRLLNFVIISACLFFLTGCSVDSTQIRFANTYKWEQTKASERYSSVASSTSMKARSIAHITDSFPAPIEPTRGSFFPLTAARFTLGSFSEGKRSESDYI